MKHAYFLISLLVAMPAIAEQSRELDAHEHGVGALNIAIEGKTLAMEFHAPGTDIVGFEYGATSDTDLEAIEAALEILRAPLEMFVVPVSAGCSVTEARAELEGEEEHDEDHGEDHDEEKHEDHDDHDAHEDEAGHTEFHALYKLTCENPADVTQIAFKYFETFPNANELEVQIIDTSGARAFEVERADPVLDLNT